MIVRNTNTALKDTGIQYSIIQSHHQLQYALDFGLLKHMSLWCVLTIIQSHHQLQYELDFSLLKHMSLWCVSTIIQSHHQLQYALDFGLLKHMSLSCVSTIIQTGRSPVRTVADDDFELYSIIIFENHPDNCHEQHL